jgi:glucose-6-phosphate isomerase
MSSNKFTPKFAPLRFDSSGAFIPGGLSRDDWVAIITRLETARRTISAEFDAEMSQASRAASGHPRQWVAGAAEPAVSDVNFPELILADYRRQRRTSELGRILAAAKRLREAVDRVVVVGSEADCAAARALFDACCHPYHNEQARGDRGGRPRIYFAGGDLDNDALQGLLDLLPHGRPVATIDERWGIIAIDVAGTKDGNAERTENAERRTANAVSGALFTALVRSCGGDSQAATRLFERAERCGAPPPEGGTPTGVFSVAGLLPGSIMGLDVVRLLEGGAAMNERFRVAPIGDSPPLDFAGVRELMAQQRGSSSATFVPWGRGLAATALLLESTASLNLNIKSQISDLTINLITESVRRDRISIDEPKQIDDPSKSSGATLPDLQATAIDAAKAASQAAGRPSVDIRLSALDESSLGQLFQMMRLSLRVLGVLRG